MASKRQPPSTISKVISSPIVSTPQPQQQLKHAPPAQPPPSPPLPGLSAQEVRGIMGEAVAQMREEMKQFIIQFKSEIKSDFKEEMKDQLEKNNNTLRQDILAAVSGLATVVVKLNARLEEVEDKVDSFDDKIQNVERKVETSQEDILMFQYRQMEYALRIRGLKEDMNQDLMEVVLTDLAVVLDMDKEELRREVEKVYRLNSWIAKQKNLPRDVVIYFTKKSLRNEIIQAFYNKRFQIAAQDVIILKEIPSKILRSRKDFAFLANELKVRLMPFRWEIPIGIVLSHAGTRYRLNTVDKAREFYTSVLGAGSTLPVQKSLSGKEAEQQSEALDLVSAGMLQAEWQHQMEVKEQRMTRAAYKRKEKEQRKKEAKEISPGNISPPVGGARPKSYATHAAISDFQGVFSRLCAKGDGKVSDLEC